MVAVTPPARLVRRATAVGAIIASPAVIVVVLVISGPHRLAVIFVAALDHTVEPFSNRHAGPARGVAGSFAGFWMEASEVPRTARFHCARSNHIRRNEDGPVLSLDSLKTWLVTWFVTWLANRRSGGRGL